MKTALIIVLATAGCADILDIPNPVPESEARCSGTIKVKMLFDASGPTKDVGVSWFKASMDHIRDINDKGGILGCKIDAESIDYGYSEGNATIAYDTWKAQPDWKDVVAILGWGSQDTILLGPRAAEDRKPFISGSYIASVAAPAAVMHDEMVPELSPQTFTEVIFDKRFTSAGYAYNFFAGTDYSTGARIAMFHISAAGGKRVGFFHCSSAYCQEPLFAARGYAKEKGLELGRELVLELGGATVTQDQFDAAVLTYFQEEKAHETATYKPVDWVWGGNTLTTSAMMAKSIAKANATLSMNVQLIVNNWGFDEHLFGLCGPVLNNPCVDKVHGIMPFIAYGDARAGDMPTVTALHDKYRGIDGDDVSLYKDVRYVQGYVNVLVFKKAVERVVRAGDDITGENIKAALETFAGEATGGLTDAITFKPSDHRPQSSEQIYKFDTAGRLVSEGNIRTIATKEEWLGW